jgi:hypothetical protein
MVAASPLPSDEDLIKQLSALPEHLKGEIIEGELFVQPRPRFRHARATGFMTHHVGGPFDMDEGGPGGWWVLPGPGIELPRAPEVSPDVGGWRRKRMPAPPAEGDPIRLAPDWVCPSPPWSCRSGGCGSRASRRVEALVPERRSPRDRPATDARDFTAGSR